MSMLKLLHDHFEGLGKILESGLGKAFGFVLEGQLYLVLLAERDDVCVCVSDLRLQLGYCKCMRYQSLVPSH